MKFVFISKTFFLHFLLVFPFEDHSFYLLESRLFDVETDAMEGVYLNVFYPDFTEYEPYSEDVWDFDHWGLVED